MTAERRLAKLEESLSPTQLVLRWLAEAHAYGDLEAYVASLLAQDPPGAPLDQLAREAARGARTATRGKRQEVVEPAIRSALRETVFRFELVMRINVTTYELLDREMLIDAALSAHVALATSEDARDPQRLAKLRDLLGFRVSELRAAQEARTIVESHYLDGHGTLFPDAESAWVDQVRSTQMIADMAVRLAEIDGVPPHDLPDPEAAFRRTAELVADLVEPAKSTASEKLGEGEQAIGIAAGWLRTRAGVKRFVDLGGTP
jgi:hypothetical protein